MIVSPQGYLITNNHVVEGASEIEVGLKDGREAKARLVGTDPDTDVAVLKIELERLPAITLGNVEALQVGDQVLAIGNPFNVGQTVTSGIVSALGRNQLGLSAFEISIRPTPPSPRQFGGAGRHRRPPGGHQHRDLLAPANMGIGFDSGGPGAR